MIGKPEISVIVCTHNPNPAYLQEVIGGLRNQTIPAARWELIVVDNNSAPPLEGSLLAGWHPAGKMLFEPLPGKTNALAAGILASKSDLLLTIDDDNLPDARYLENAIRLAGEWPALGVFSASIEGRFEVGVAAWAASFLQLLAVRPLDGDYWGNTKGENLFPIGAGMVFRRALGLKFVEEAKGPRFPHHLSRSGGKTFAGAEDTLFGYLALADGHGLGAFRDLKLTHFMPARRLTLGYLTEISRSLSYSHTILDRLYGSAGRSSLSSFAEWRLRLRRSFQNSKKSKEERQILKAHLDGYLMAAREAL